MKNEIEASVLGLPEVCPRCKEAAILDPRTGGPYCDTCGESIQYIWKGKVYIKEAYQPMRPYIVGEDLSDVSVSDEDIPELGGMIAYNPNNFKDKWYISQEFFESNYGEVK